MSTVPEPTHISTKAALKLAGWKPVKNQTRNDLLVYGGWLTSRWEWSRDVDVSLDQAIANSRRLGEDVRIVGNPKPADRKRVRGRKKHAVVQVPSETEVRVPLLLPPVSSLPPAPKAPEIEASPPLREETEFEESFERKEPPVEESVERRTPMPAVVERAAPSPTDAKSGPSPTQGSRLLLERFFIAAALCSVALFLGYFGLAGTYYVSILLMADAFFVVATSVLALKDRRVFGGRGRNATVNAADVSAGK